MAYQATAHENRGGKIGIFKAATYNVHRWRNRRGIRDPDKTLRVIGGRADVMAIPEVSFCLARSRPFHLRDLEAASDHLPVTALMEPSP